MGSIVLNNGMSVLVDDDLFDELNQHRWTYQKRRNGRGYAVRCVRGSDGKYRTICLHRVVAQTPEGMFADHIDGNPLNCTRANLRNVTRQENSWNRRAKASSTSQFIGVSWSTRARKWLAQIMIENRVRYLGAYASEVEAAMVRDTATREHYGAIGRLNFKDGTP
jgi:hypothetical protein